MTRRKETRRVTSTPLPLGSVAQPVGPLAVGTEACLSCGAQDVVRIRMGVASGRNVVFVSCPRCEHTAWFDEDGDGTPLSSEDITGIDPAGGRQAPR